MTTGKSPRRIDVPPTTDDLQLDNLPHLLPGLTRLAELLLISRARGETATARALTPSDLASYDLTLADCRQLLASGLIETAEEKGVRRQASGVRKSGSGRKVAGSLREPTAGQGEGGSKSPSPSGRGQGEGGRKAPAASHRKLVPAKDVRPPRGYPASGVGKNAGPPKLTPRTPLHLTDAGLAFITTQSRLLQPSPSGRGQGEGAWSALGAASGVPRSTLLPHYDIETRELSVAGVVILRLPVQARNLAAVLTAFQLAGWKQRVAKPFNGRRAGVHRHIVAMAAYSLNLRQQEIDFHGDGDGIRWHWRVVLASSPPDARKRRANRLPYSSP